MASSCSPIRQNFRRQLSDSLLADMSIFSENNYFLTIGRVTPWETEVSAGLSSSYASSVPLAVDSDETETGFWENIVAAKRLTQDNLSLVIPRFDWKLGAVYEPYINVLIIITMLLLWLLLLTQIQKYENYLTVIVGNFYI